VVAAPDSVSGSWYPNLRAEIIPTGANQLWVSDITYVRLERAFVFLAVVLDVFARKVIGYAIGPTLDARLPRAALDAAIERRQPPPGCVHHHEEIYPRGNRTMADVIAHLPHFLEQIYNNKRQHSALNYRSPNAFEADHALTLPSSQISTT
jgi:putative transposase